MGVNDKVRWDRILSQHCLPLSFFLALSPLTLYLWEWIIVGWMWVSGISPGCSNLPLTQRISIKKSNNESRKDQLPPTLTQQIEALKHTHTHAHTPTRGTHHHCCQALPFSTAEPFLPSFSCFNATDLMVADGRSRLGSLTTIKSPTNRSKLRRGHKAFEWNFWGLIFMASVERVITEWCCGCVSPSLLLHFQQLNGPRATH